MSQPLLTFADASITPLFAGITAQVEPGQCVAVLGPNGAGKSTLLGAILGTRHLTSGHIEVAGRVGYIPQQRMFNPELPMRARDLVALAIPRQRAGLARLLPHRGGTTANATNTASTAAPAPATTPTELLERVGAGALANARVGLLSGGQQQLIRQAQALANAPEILLCDEPLLSLDMGMQARFIDLLGQLRAQGTAIIFVTHSINPIVRITDRVLYLAPNGHEFGTVDSVLTTETLSRLYGSHVDVVRVGERLVVL